VGKLFLAQVEGSRIEVCESCGKYGNVLKEARSEVKRVFIKKVIAPELEESEEEFKSNYGRLIIQARQKMGLERKEFAMKINEKESIIRRVELQQMIPDEKVRKKIEKFLEIKLTEAYGKIKLNKKSTKSTLTLGDIIQIG